MPWIPPHTPLLHPEIPKLSTRWRAGAGRPAPLSILRPSAPSGMGLHLGLLKPRVPEFAKQAHVFGGISCPTPQVSDLSQWGSSNKGISPETSVYIGVSPCSGMPQPPGLLDLPQTRPQPRGLPVQATSRAPLLPFRPHALLLPDPTLGEEAPFPFTSAPGPRGRPSPRPRLSDVQHPGRSGSWEQDTRLTRAGRGQLGGGAWVEPWVWPDAGQGRGQRQGGAGSPNLEASLSFHPQSPARSGPQFNSGTDRLLGPT